MINSTLGKSANEKQIQYIIIIIIIIKSIIVTRRRRRRRYNRYIIEGIFANQALIGPRWDGVGMVLEIDTVPRLAIGLRASDEDSGLHELGP